MKQNKNGMSIQITNLETVELIKKDMNRRGCKTYKEWIDSVMCQIEMDDIYDYGTMVLDSVTGYHGKVTAHITYYGMRENSYLVEGLDSTGRPITEWIDCNRCDDLTERKD